MSQLTREQARKVAHLSRLEFTDAEADAFAGQLSRILHYVEQLNELDTAGVPPTSHSLDITNVLREDVVLASLSNEEALANAPDQADGCFRVPSIIQES